MINITSSNVCIIENLPAELKELTKKTLTLVNPTYERTVRITGSYYAAKKFFFYYKELPKNGLIVPRGFTERFIKYLNKQGIPYEVTYDYVENTTKAFAKFPPIKLRDYQVPLVEAIVNNKVGVVAAGVGTGKTLLSLEAARRVGLKTLIIVPTTVIQNQFLEECRKWWQYEPGIIGGGTKVIKDLTISTWQSLSADEELCNELVASTAFVITDECQVISSNERSKILKKFKPLRLIGLSGSPRRSKDDGRTKSIFFYLGEIIASHMMPQVKPIVEVVRTGAKVPVSANYHEMIDALVRNDSRNTLIAGLASGEAMSGHQVLILTKRVEHCRIIKEKLPAWGDLIYHADGEDPTRNDTLLEMRSGEKDFKILIGTLSLLSAGFDVPSLDCLIFAGDLKSDVTVQQSAGRILRLFEGKESAKIYDLFDSDNPILRRQGYERQNFYKSQNWEMKI